MMSTEVCSIKGVNYRIFVAGEGDTIVLLHGGHTNLDIWEDQLAYFSDKNFKVIAYDQRGYGHTDIPLEPFAYEEDVRHILDHFGVEKAIIIGASMPT